RVDHHRHHRLARADRAVADRVEGCPPRRRGDLPAQEPRSHHRAAVVRRRDRRVARAARSRCGGPVRCRPGPDAPRPRGQVMGKLDEPAFSAILTAGCTACGHPTLEVSSFVDRSVAIMLGTPNDAGRWAYDGEKFVDGTYSVRCARCKHVAWSDP